MLELLEVVLVHDDIAGHVHVDAALVRIGDDLRHLLEREVARTRSHAKLVAGKVDRIRAKADGILELLPAACRREELRLLGLLH